MPAPSDRKHVLMSIKTPFVEKILEGRKQYELRRRRPRIEPGSLVYVYEPAPTKEIRMMFHAGDVMSLPKPDMYLNFRKELGTTIDSYYDYFEGCDVAHAISIDYTWRLKNHVTLEQLRAFGLRAPQSYCYLDQAKADLIYDYGCNVPKDARTIDHAAVECPY